jgi:hypothetical protein
MRFKVKTMPAGQTRLMSRKYPSQHPLGILWFSWLYDSASHNGRLMLAHTNFIRMKLLSNRAEICFK